MIKKLIDIIRYKEVRLEFRCISWGEANELIKQDNSWRIAQEEDNNYNRKLVFIERVTKKSRFF